MAAYFAAGARIGAWALVSAIVYRRAGPAHFAMLALIRGTIGILNYTSVGLAPAMIWLFAGADAQHGSKSTERAIYSTGVFVALISALAGLLVAGAYSRLFAHLHVVPPALASQVPWAVLLIGTGTIVRLFSDTSGALLQVRGHIALDNYLLATSDLFWATATVLLFGWAGLLAASITYSVAGIVLMVARGVAVTRLSASPWPPSWRVFDRALGRRLLSFGSLVLLAQLAEYFYAPTDYILINHFFGPAELSAYAPGVQIDVGLLMLVTGLATVLLPRSAIAHAAGQTQSLRRYYWQGTVASTALLAVVALCVWLLSPAIFHLWFGDHPPNTGPILHLVLIGTVIGGSSAVGRSLLIGTGRIKALTAAAIVAGVANVVASYCFVKFGHLGLDGILYGTLVAVIGRCGLWMPWYVVRSLRK